jgi:aminoglycoside phosphotransferase family enzyme/predicted kinase
VTEPNNQADIVAFLTRLAGRPPLETHISYLFLGQDTVWKLKKSVCLPFVDFSKLEDRHRFCERELALNAPTAPGLYRDVVAVVRQADGSIAIGGEGEVRDWVVRMARVAAEDFLDVRAATEGLTTSLLDRIADSVAEFHMALPPVPGINPDMEAIAEGNVLSALSAGLSRDEVIGWRGAMLAGLAAIRVWRDARAASGFIRRCHGDLHLGNLCLWRGRPVPFDALEFDEALGTVDVAYDLAFLLMDLEHRLDRAAANRVLNRYVARTGDAALVTALPLCLSMRAMIRAHVEARSGHPGEVDTYLAAAAQYLKPPPPVVIAIGGLPGTGKSTLARSLAPSLGAAPGALIPRSDEIRKRQHGVLPEQRLPPIAYTEQKSAAVFGELASMTEAAAKGGHAVIADATIIDLMHRSMVATAAERAGTQFLGIWLTAPTAELERRIAGRGGDASDATIAVLHAAAVHDPGPAGWHEIDSTNAASAEREALTLAKAPGASHIAL